MTRRICRRSHTDVTAGVTGSLAAGTCLRSWRGLWVRCSGCLAVNTTLYVGPLADIAGGVDLSTVGSAALAGLLYVASLGFIKG